MQSEINQIDCKIWPINQNTLHAISNSYYIGSGAMAHILLESRGREAPEGECNIEPLHRSLYNN